MTPSFAHTPALKDKIALVTGAGGTMGRAVVAALIEDGCRIGLIDVNAQSMAPLEALYGEAVVAVACDISDQQAVLAAQARVEQRLGPIDVLVNNAGISQRSRVLDTSLEVYRRIFELDFFATVALTKAVLPGMVQRKRGHVVVVSSVVGYISSPLRSGYAAAKHALHGFYDAARAEHWRDGVKFTVACPGYVKTEVSMNAVTGDGGRHGKVDPSIARGVEPAYCARKIWRAVEKDCDEVLVGREALVVYLKRFFPALFSWGVNRANPIQ